MYFRIRLVSDEVDGFLREYEIDSEATFLDLNKIILDSCGYPDDQMTSFYVCSDEWERGEQITREDMGGGGADEDTYVMQSTRLSEFLDEKGQKLEFVFDPFSERSFFLNVKDVLSGTMDQKAKTTRQKGDAPVHIAELDFSMPDITKKGDDYLATDDEDFYGSDAFNDDDFDPEGFEISQNPY